MKANYSWLFLCLLLGSCTKLNPCKYEEARSVSVKIAAKSGSDSIMRVYGIGGKSDILPVDFDGSFKTYKLYFNLAEDQVAYVFEHQNLNDTLSFQYVRRSYFISDRCGYGTKCDIQKVRVSPRLKLQAISKDTSFITITY